MELDITHMFQGFGSHVTGGILGGLSVWVMELFFRLWERRKQHAKFDRSISEFAWSLKLLIEPSLIPMVMARVVPLASKATFGTETPALKEKHYLPHGTELNCRICERFIEPNFEGRCPTCRLGCSSYHGPRRHSENRAICLDPPDIGQAAAHKGATPHLRQSQDL